MSRPHRPSWIAALTLLAAWPAMASQCNIQLLPSIPVTMQGLRPMVSTRINGRKARFIIDTGAFWSMLSPAAEAKFGLPERLHTTGLRLQGVTGGAESDVAIAYTFHFIDHDFHAVEFLVGGNDFGSGAAGLLGGSLLRIANAEFDFAHGKMRFFKARHCGAQPLAYWAANQPVGVVALEPSDSRDPSLIGHALLNGKRITVQFDTGSTRSMLTLAAARRAGITPDSPGVKPAGSIYGIGTDTSKSWIAPISSFEIGGEKIENTHVLMGDLKMQDVDMLLGADFFLSHRVSVAYGRNKLYFTYNGGPIFNRGQPYWIKKAGGALVQGGTAVAPAAKPASADELEREGMAYLSERQFAAALADFNRACALEPENADFLFQRGKAYLSQDQSAEALSDLDAAIGLQPKLYRARLVRASLLLQWQGAPANARSEASADADVVDQLAPQESELRFPLADVYARLGRYRTATREIDDWMHYHSQDVTLPDGYTMRCWIRAEADTHLHQALRDCDRALGKLPKSAAVLEDRALVYLRLRRLDRSIGDYGSALKIDPHSATALYGRGLAELRDARSKAGQADIAAAMQRDPKVVQRFARMGLSPAATAR
jgi:tetratricopeptide (TPR) repeat protein/predicted aspartyl protease